MGMIRQKRLAEQKNESLGTVAYRYQPAGFQALETHQKMSSSVDWQLTFERYKAKARKRSVRCPSLCFLL
jgi:hypothetical protein